MGGTESDISPATKPAENLFITQMNQQPTQGSIAKSERSSSSSSATSPSSTLSQSSYKFWIADQLGRISGESSYAIAGATAGLISGVAVCPLDVVKTKLQAQGGFSKNSVVDVQRYNGFIGTIRTIWKTEGVRGFYRGVVPITFGYLPTWMIYFSVYERCKDKLPTLLGLENQPTVVHLVAALCAGGSSTTITNPIWVVKTRLMTQSADTAWHYKGTIDAFRCMYKNEGLISFYAGLLPALLGLLHVAVQFPLYEKFKLMFVPAPDTHPSELRKVSGIIFASSLSKMLASIVTYPHEVVRTRMQIQRGLSREHQTHYNGVIKTVTTLLKDEGWRVFYSGLGTNMVRTVPASAVTLITYELLVDRFTTLREQRKRRLQDESTLQV